MKKEVMLVGANDLHVGRQGQRAFISSEVLFFVSNDK
jgi:hypothetical protein